MKYKDSIKWLESLKQQIGQAQHSDLWHFEQAIDETIDNLRPLAEPHGRLIDADELWTKMRYKFDVVKEDIEKAPTIIEAEQSESESMKYMKIGEAVMDGILKGLSDADTEMS